MAVQIIKAFAEDTMKDTAAVAEVVQLTPVLNNDQSRFLLKVFIDTVDGSEMLQFHSLKGLAKVVRGAAPGSIDSNDLVSILRSLHKRLRPTHSPSHQYRLLDAVSRVLDAMVDAHVGDVDRINLHAPLTEFLRESEWSEDPYLTFQAAYATQALLNVSDNENIWHAGLRRGWLILKGGAGFAKMPDPREVKDALEGLERLHEAGKGGVRMLKYTLEAIKTGESPTFTVKEGLKFKRAWYRALRIAESYIQTGKLVHFKELVTTSPCRHQLMFQWGIVQLLGQFAGEKQWDVEPRRDAVAFLGALYKTDSIWKRCEETDLIIPDMLAYVVSSNGADFKVAKELLEEMRRQGTAPNQFASLHPVSWSNGVPSDPAEDATAVNTLLKTVQNRNFRRAKVERLPVHPPKPRREDIQSALKTYYAPSLIILRVSGDSLDLETCYINLAIVEAPAQREQDKQDLKEQAGIFHRIPSSEVVGRVNLQTPIPLEQLFNKRKLRDGKEDIPKTILVQGRAGIGKTTLCKKLVHAHQTGLWRDRFDTVLWLPLRQIKAFKARTLEDLFREKFFSQGPKKEGKALARALEACAQNHRVLFVLDGLDEIAMDTRREDDPALKIFLETLLAQHYVVITSRPSGVDRSLLPTIDLELETIGFSPQNVSDFLTKVLEPEAVKTVQDFIQRTPLMQGLVNIPVQLDVICYSWDSLPMDGPTITMTGLYRLMVWKLWCKDAFRQRKSAKEGILTQEDLSQLEPYEIDELMATEMQHLGYLAFKGLLNDYQIEFDGKALLDA
ncbi:hypothetical protein BGZ72_005613, partial [Mortierella alpina]